MNDDDRHEFNVGDRVMMFGKIVTEGAGGHEWLVRFDSEGPYPPKHWVMKEALFHDHDKPLPQPTDTVRELNKRVTALQQRLERVRDYVHTYVDREHETPLLAIIDDEDV